MNIDCPVSCNRHTYAAEVQWTDIFDLSIYFVTFL